jgi:hypothetical protein
MFVDLITDQLCRLESASCIEDKDAVASMMLWQLLRTVSLGVVIRPESDHGGKCVEDANDRLSDDFIERFLLQEHKQECFACWRR